MMKHFAGIAVAAVAATVWLISATEQRAQAQAEWINAVRQGGYVIVFRHGATHQDQADTDPLNPKNVAQQRSSMKRGARRPRRSVRRSASSGSLSARSSPACSIARSKPAR